MKKINHFISALIVAAMSAGFASCSSSDEPSSVSDNTPKELTLTIMSTKPATKAALDGSSAPTTNDENTINRITIGIFSSDGQTVRTIQEFSDGTASSADETAGTNKFYNVTNGSATVKVVTTKLDPTDQVLVAINAPADKFQGILKAQDFKDASIDATKAIATDATNNPQSVAQPKNIPMFGEKTNLTGSGNSYSATVDVYHLTAKITLSSLSVAFDANGPYSDASFTPEEIFLYSVPDGLKFNYSAPYLTSPTYYTGENGSTGLVVKDFLSSGALTSSALNSSNTSFGKTYYFYTTPNNDVNTNKTKLVIKGKFKKNSSDTESDVYYPVSLNHKVEANGSTGAADGTLHEYQVYPNKNYQCSVVIKTIGSTGPDVDIDPTTAEISITVKDWDPISQTTVFQ